MSFSVLDFFKRVGFTLPSSRYLSDRMVSLVDTTSLSHIIELGAGKGVITEKLINHINPHTRLDIFEIDPASVSALQKKYSRHKNVHIHSLDAVDISTLFPNHSVDLVISTLPLGSLDKNHVHSILESIHQVLRLGGQFIQYQYWMVNRGDVEKFFHIQKTHFEPRNFTPAFIYNTIKKEKQ